MPIDRVAFLDRHLALATVRVDGSGEAEISAVGPEAAPVWSPDGRKIAYDDYYSGVQIVNADGTNQVLVSNPDPFPDFSWSPDSKHIAFTKSDDPQRWPTRIDVANDDGTHRRPLVRCGQCGSPSWAPNGREILYVDRCRLFLVNADGTRKRAFPGAVPYTHGILPVGEWACVASWSPSGKQIVYTQLRTTARCVNGACGFIYVANRDGSGGRRLVGGRQPSWSPDGKRIAFIRADPAITADVAWVINANGRKERRLFRATALSWSPDGAHLAVSRMFKSRRGPHGGRHPGKYGIWIVEPNGSNGRQIWPATGTCDCDYAAWQPH